MVRFVRFLRGSQIPIELCRCIESAEVVKIAVAFLKEGGYREIQKSLRLALSKDKKIVFIVGACLYYHITDPKILNELKQLEEKYKSLKLRFFYEGSFHPKLFIFVNQNNVKVILGSSNLTSGGMSSNIEANMVVEGTVKDKVIKDILAFFDNEIDAFSHQLTNDYIQYYKEHLKTFNQSFEKIKKHPIQVSRLTLKSRKNYPHQNRKLSSQESEEIRKKIAKIPPDIWKPIYCINLADEYTCNAYQIRGIKAWVHHASSWEKNLDKKQTTSYHKINSTISSKKRAILWSTNRGNHIQISMRYVSEKKATLWGVDFKVRPEQYEFPITGYLYIKGDSVKYKARIASIETHPRKQQPKEINLWPKEFRKNLHKTYLKLIKLTPLRTLQSVSDFTKLNGEAVKGPEATQNHVRIIDPQIS